MSHSMPLLVTLAEGHGYVECITNVAHAIAHAIGQGSEKCFLLFLFIAGIAST